MESQSHELSLGPLPKPKPRHDKTTAKKKDSKPAKASSALLADITFERKNKPQPRLPPGHTIQKRPILHPPIAAPYAGPDVQKVVYVSKNTPIMAAVKRVKKLLEQAQKRNLQREGVLGKAGRAGNIAAATQNTSGTKQEVVLVKGSGRAMEQAAKVAEWFKRHAEDGDGGWVVDVRASSVKVIDDIVEDHSTNVDSVQMAKDHSDGSAGQDGKQLNCLEGENTRTNGETIENQSENAGTPLHDNKPMSQTAETTPKWKTKRAVKRKRPIYNEDDIPEARTRFINAIEIAVSLKG